MAKKRKLFIWLAVAVMLNLFHAATAQSNWMQRKDKQMISFEWLKPSLKYDQGITFGTGVYYLSAKLPMSDRNTFVAEIPYAKFGIELDRYDYSENKSTVGNIYLGFEMGENDNPISTEFGVRLPVVSEEDFEAAFIGIATDWDRVDAFVNDIIPMTFKVNSRTSHGNGLVTRISFGPQVWYVTDKEAEDKMELFLLYSAHGGFETDQLGMGAGLSGRFWVTMGEGAKLSDQMTHQLDMNVFGKFNKIRPGVYVRVPMDDELDDMLESVIGLNVSFVLN